MATKQEDIKLKIQPQYCSKEIKNAFNKVGNFEGYDSKSKMYYGTYKYVFQKVNIGILLANDKGNSKLRLIGETDDLIGTGANKAIKKLIEYLKSVEPQYIIDYKIDEAFSAILKKDYVNGKDILSNALSQRPDVFKVLFGLGLCYLNENNSKKGEEYIVKAVVNTPKGEKRINTTRKVVSVLWSLKEYSIAQELFKSIAEDTKAENKDKLFYMLLMFNSKNYSKLAVALTKEFPQNKEFVLRLLKDSSLEKECREEFIKKLPGLIKAYRKKVVFNIIAPSIKYLIANNSFKIPQQYRSNLDRFYKSKDINIVDLISLYGSIIELLKVADMEAEALLKKRNSKMLDSIISNTTQINIFNKNNSLFPNKKELDSISKEIENCSSSLSGAKSFIQKFNAVQECQTINTKCEVFIEKYKKELPNYIDNLISEKKAKQAEKVIEVYNQVYKTLPNNIEDTSKIIESLKIARKNKTIKLVKIGIIASVVILVSIIIFNIMS